MLETLLCTPEENGVVALLSLLLTLNIQHLLPVFLLLNLNMYLFSGFDLFIFLFIVFRLTLIRLGFLRVVLAGGGQSDPPHSLRLYL